MENKNKRVHASFRDPSGFVFREKNVIYRQINLIYQKDFDLLKTTGLYQRLVDEGLLISHKEVEKKIEKPGYKIIKPYQLPFISYPYEWSFSQLKDAALATLKIQQISLKYGMSLKDASAYNIQFVENHPMLIDTLSFVSYKEGEPWVAYKQFCQHFLAPLALMSKTDLRLGRLGLIYLDGVPLDLCARLLPNKTKFSLGLGTHIHLHAKSQLKYTDPGIIGRQSRGLGKNQFLGILNSLESTAQSLDLPKQKTIWGSYYEDTNYSPHAFNFKKKTISAWIEKLNPKSAWDAGSNDGTFSRLASSKNIPTIASDIDEVAVERSYRAAKAEKDRYILPLIIDLTNPSPSIGWHNQERPSYLSRCSFDLVMCLAFIHHLAIANNLPLSYIAQFFAEYSKNLIIEFVPKEDSNTKRLLTSRNNLFPDYTQSDFEREFSAFFKIIDRKKITGSHRILYLMRLKNR